MMFKFSSNLTLCANISFPRSANTKMMIAKRMKKVNKSCRDYIILTIITWKLLHFRASRNTLNNLKPLNNVRAFLFVNELRCSYYGWIKNRSWRKKKKKLKLKMNVRTCNKQLMSWNWNISDFWILNSHSK